MAPASLTTTILQNAAADEISSLSSVLRGPCLPSVRTEISREKGSPLSSTDANTAFATSSFIMIPMLCALKTCPPSGSFYCLDDGQHQARHHVQPQVGDKDDHDRCSPTCYVGEIGVNVNVLAICYTDDVEETAKVILHDIGTAAGMETS
ncbi:hypothetical protein CONLIGDRAFT_719445 [Coniochaeta ligniaria NRRL 30616]|uniref:Uncharacterized protein n=1 Tax=Coniochaeta ligniaria NRRL 30616 TaxID=1408157 RepID=A0A1J7J6R6_9PEZI|nr:hypothetical protein CONLIGDRAFT_719445 [Coniochaeta ligniaria NRRL 30616]